MTHSTSIINLVDQSKLFGFRLGLALRLAFLHSLHLVLFLLLGLGDFRTRLDLLNNCGFLCSCWLDWGRYGFSWCWDQDDVDKFALRWPDTDDDELVKWIVLADRIDFIGELRIQISKSHDDPMLLLDCLMLKANDRFNQVLKPSCRRSFLQTAQFLHLQSFLRFLSFFALFLGHWLLELHNSLDNSNIFLLKLMLKVVSKLEGSIGIGPAQFSLF